MYRVFQKCYFPKKHKKKFFWCVWVTLYINKTNKK